MKNWNILLLLMFIAGCATQPLFSPAQFNRLGTEAAESNEFQKAIQIFSEGLKQYPKEQTIYRNRAFTYLQTGEFDNALADINMATQINPGYIDAYGIKGLILRDMGNTAEAIVTFSEAIELAPGVERYYGSRGEIYEKRGDYELALKDYGKALEINPQSPRAIESIKRVHDASGGVYRSEN